MYISTRHDSYTCISTCIYLIDTCISTCVYLLYIYVYISTRHDSYTRIGHVRAETHVGGQADMRITITYTIYHVIYIMYVIVIGIPV